MFTSQLISRPTLDVGMMNPMTEMGKCRLIAKPFGSGQPWRGTVTFASETVCSRSSVGEGLEGRRDWGVGGL